MSNVIEDKALNRWVRDMEKSQADAERQWRQYLEAQQPGATVEPVTLSMQEYLDIKALIEEIKGIDEILRHRNSDNTLIDGAALVTACTLARRLSLP